MGEDDTEQAPQVGTVLEGRYRLLETLGSGGVGWVYRAKHLRLAQDVAIKMLKEQYAQHELLRPRFDREAQALAALRHPNIVSLTDYSIGESGHPYLVMEMLEGKTLADAIEAGPIEESRARRILGQILDALTYAHSRGFAHRDIKPSNVFLVSLPTDPDHVKILDFGFVKLMSVEAPPTESQALTRSGIAFGTPSYMCPEQATGGDTDPRSDLYSTTVVFFEMLAGRRPYIGEIPDVIRAHLTEPVPPLSVGGANLRAKPELRAFLERGMAKEPVDRFDSAEDMKSALVALPTPMLGPADAAGDPTARHPAETPTAAPPARERPPGERPPHERPPGRAPRHAAGYVALAALGLGGLIAIPLALFALSGAAGSSDAVASDALASDAVSAEGITPPAMEARWGVPPSEDPEPIARSPNPGDAVDEPPLDDTAGALPFDETGEVLAEGEEPAMDMVFDEPVLEEPVLEEPAIDEEPAIEAPSDALAAAEPEPTERPHDPWTGSEPDAYLDRLRAGLASRRRPLGRSAEEHLRDWVRDHRTDARGHLLLAAQYIAVGHTLSAIRRFALAQQIDARTKNDPTVLEDVARLTAEPGASPEAVAFLRSNYGPEAIAAVEAQRARPNLDRRTIERLDHALSLLRAR